MGTSAAIVIIDATRKSSQTALINAWVEMCDAIRAFARIAARGWFPPIAFKLKRVKCCAVC